MTTPYCGLKQPTTGKRRGTQQECLETNQVRYYGKKKISQDEIIKKKLLIEKKSLERKLREDQVSITAMVKKGENLIKDINRYESKKYLKESLAQKETEKEKEKEKKRIKKRLTEIKEEGNILGKKIQTTLKRIEETKKKIIDVNKELE